METTIKKQQTVQSIFAREDVKARFEKMLGKKSNGFITSVLQIVASSDYLKNADALSIYNGAATAAALDLPLNNSLGLAYLIPFNTKQSNGTSKVMAVFCIGYRGLINLALRTSQYKNIDATPIYEGQLISQSPLKDCVFVEKKKSNKIIGYAAGFSLTGGFEKNKFMRTEEIIEHAKKHSKTYGKKGSAWDTNFDDMACKTVLRLLLSKFAPLSVDYQRVDAIDEQIYPDLANETAETTDAVYVETNEERNKLVVAIDKANTAEDLSVLKVQIGADDYLDLQEAIDGKIEKINTTKKK